QKAFSSLAGIPIVGPVLGGLAAAAATAAGVVRIKKIASTKFGGGASASTAAPSAGVSASTASNVSINAPPEREMFDRRPIIINWDSRKITSLIVEDSIKSKQRNERGLEVRT
ncbi:MAG: hypothetical protein KAJ19_21245, partial [Gammaproteobacteria bacterium]|nr:hypothetical protein [Gammaproteobacteria bacterium]